MHILLSCEVQSRTVARKSSTGGLDIQIWQIFR